MTALRDIWFALSFAVRVAVSTYRRTRYCQRQRVVGDSGPF